LIENRFTKPLDPWLKKFVNFVKLLVVLVVKCVKIIIVLGTRDQLLQDFLFVFGKYKILKKSNLLGAQFARTPGRPRSQRRQNNRNEATQNEFTHEELPEFGVGGRHKPLV
jgi:hypothetical protein